MIYTPDVNYFLRIHQRTRLAKEAREIFNLDDLQKALGRWRHFHTHGQVLLSVIQNSRHVHLWKSQRSVEQGSQSQQMLQDSQMASIWQLPITPALVSQRASLQSRLTVSSAGNIRDSVSASIYSQSPGFETPSHPASQLWPLEFQTPSQGIPIPPVPDLTMSTQTAATDISPGPRTPVTPLASNIMCKRRPLGSISGNTTPKRVRQDNGKTTMAGEA
jgi:hypothetical protein